MSRNPFRKSVGFYEVMATSYTSGSTSNSSEPAYSRQRQTENMNSTSPTHESSRNVGFSNIKDQHTERKKKYLTAKYGAHQMLLIKKRLGVEMWIFDELRKLYNTEDHDHECELELEEILNLDEDSQRREYALEQLQAAKQSPEEVNKFVDELLKRARTL